MRQTLLFAVLLLAVQIAGAQELRVRVGSSADMSCIVDTGVDYTHYLSISSNAVIGVGAGLSFSRNADERVTYATGDKSWNNYINEFTIPVFLRAKYNMSSGFFVQADAGYRIPAIKLDFNKGGSSPSAVWSDHHGPFINAEAGYMIKGRYGIGVGAGVNVYNRGERTYSSTAVSAYKKVTAVSPAMFVGFSFYL